jgi:hypothetical protein
MTLSANYLSSRFREVFSQHQATPHRLRPYSVDPESVVRWEGDRFRSDPRRLYASEGLSFVR